MAEITLITQPTNTAHFIRFHEILEGSFVEGDTFVMEDNVTSNKRGAQTNAYLKRENCPYQPIIYTLAVYLYAWNPNRIDGVRQGLDTQPVTVNWYNLDTLTIESSDTLLTTGDAGNYKFFFYYDQTLSIVAGNYKLLINDGSGNTLLVSNTITVLAEEWDENRYSQIYWGQTCVDEYDSCNVENFDYDLINDVFDMATDITSATNLGNYFFNNIWLDLQWWQITGQIQYSEYLQNNNNEVANFNTSRQNLIQLKGNYWDAETHIAMLSVCNHNHVYVNGRPIQSTPTGWAFESVQINNRSNGEGSFYDNSKTSKILDSYGYDTDIRALPTQEAYSLYLVQSSYTGNCVRIRRSTDDVEQDFGFVDNVVDTASIDTFLSGATGYVVTWYDQSTNSNDVMQSDTSIQPLINTTDITIEFDDLTYLQQQAASTTSEMVFAAKGKLLNEGTLDSSITGVDDSVNVVRKALAYSIINDTVGVTYITGGGVNNVPKSTTISVGDMWQITGMIESNQISVVEENKSITVESNTFTGTLEVTEEFRVGQVSPFAGRSQVALSTVVNYSYASAQNRLVDIDNFLDSI